ncbi:MAG: hypothetical protein AAGJ81_08275 [Verrucomicrobiota bacterium]
MKTKENEGDWLAWPPPENYRGIQVSLRLADGVRTWANRYGLTQWHIREESISPPSLWRPTREINGMTA